ncbi:MAG: argininosuccinate lyase [Candidatus Omnitrophica bacterium]|nr:argininosuccinate lyase [Candidatus Omnitrophota bacterium]
MKRLWGGRFKKELSLRAKEFSYSLAVDGVLLDAEITVNEASAKALTKTRILTKAECGRILKALALLRRRFSGRDLKSFYAKYEDVHTFVQAELEKKIGSLARKIHTGRSRNDLVTTVTKVYLRTRLESLDLAVKQFQKSLLRFANKNRKIIIPGYTHIQRAQPVLMAHHILVYVEMLERDKSRLADARRRMDELPLGASALAGSGIGIDRRYLARLLGFSRVAANSMDAVSDRDYILDVLYALSVLFTHLSRLAEDFILWNSSEFNFIRLSDCYATGSSLMPQKKNPDMLELVRGRAGKVYGSLISLLVTMKGLPLAYNRDMQEDKEPLFSSVNLALRSLGVLSGLVDEAEVNKEACFKASLDSFLYATDILDYLVSKGMPFEKAHSLVGKIVRHAISSGRELWGLTVKEYKEFSPLFRDDIYQVFIPEVSTETKRTLGSTNPANVRRELQVWAKRLR